MSQNNSLTTKQRIPNTTAFMDPSSKLKQYISKEVGQRIVNLATDEESFKLFLEKAFGIGSYDKPEIIYDKVRPFFAFARRNIDDLFKKLEGGDNLRSLYYNRFFNPDQQSTPFNLVDIYLYCIEEYKRLRKEKTKSEGVLAALRSMNELHLLFFIAMKYRDYLNTSQAKLMKSGRSKQFVIDGLKKIATDKTGFDYIDTRKDNPLFDVTRSKRKYYKWDKVGKTYLLRDTPEEGYTEYVVDSMKLNLGTAPIEIAHIAMRDKDAWSLIQKGVRKGTSESHHTDYTGLKIVLEEGMSEAEQEQLVKKIFNALLDSIGDGLTWIEKPELEPINNPAFRSIKKHVRIWKGVLQAQIDGIPYPIEVQIAGNEFSHIIRDVDPLSRLYHGHYKGGQLEKLLPSFFPEAIYGKVELKKGSTHATGSSFKTPYAPNQTLKDALARLSASSSTPSSSSRPLPQDQPKQLFAEKGNATPAL